MTTEMTSRDVIEFHRQMEILGVEIWLDGGWGVDALLGKQTRPHADLDVVVQKKDLQLVVGFLSKQGFREVPREDSRPWNFVLADGDGKKEVDLHVIVVDQEGNGIYGPPAAGEGVYPADALQGTGTVDGLPVRCISAEFQIRSHTGYEFGETDIKDVAALADRFDLDMPQEYPPDRRRS